MAGIRIGAGWRDWAAEIPPRAVPEAPEACRCRAIEVGCTDWYIYPRSEPAPGECAADSPSKVATSMRRIAPAAGAWVKRPAGD